MLRGPRQVIQSYKKVITYAPASKTTAQQDYEISLGEDSVAAGQTAATDTGVPSGSVIKYFEIQACFVNLVSVAMFQNMSVQLTRSGQSPIDPRVVGGNPQRNQVHYQRIVGIGKDQNNNYVLRFKVPKKFQRVRDGDKWTFTCIADQVHTSNIQAIYKFYR